MYNNLFNVIKALLFLFQIMYTTERSSQSNSNYEANSDNNVSVVLI